MPDREVITERDRAEDILLGTLGYGQDARLITVERIPNGYKGSGSWSDGEEFSFSWDDGLDDMQEWALGLLAKAA